MVDLRAPGSIPGMTVSPGLTLAWHSMRLGGVCQHVNNWRPTRGRI